MELILGKNKLEVSYSKYLKISAYIFQSSANCLSHKSALSLYFGTKSHSYYPMRDIGLPLSSLKSHKEVAELMAADSKQRPSKSGMQTYRGRPANFTQREVGVL